VCAVSLESVSGCTDHARGVVVSLGAYRLYVLPSGWLVLLDLIQFNLGHRFSLFNNDIFLFMYGLSPMFVRFYQNACPVSRMGRCTR
jgi:hypothetical protein